MPTLSLTGEMLFAFQVTKPAEHIIPFGTLASNGATLAFAPKEGVLRTDDPTGLARYLATRPVSIYTGYTMCAGRIFAYWNTIPAMQIRVRLPPCGSVLFSRHSLCGTLSAYEADRLESFDVLNGVPELPNMVWPWTPVVRCSRFFSPSWQIYTGPGFSIFADLTESALYPAVFFVPKTPQNSPSVCVKTLAELPDLITKAIHTAGLSGHAFLKTMRSIDRLVEQAIRAVEHHCTMLDVLHGRQPLV